MLALKKKLRLDKSVWESPNLAGRFDAEDLQHIGSWVVDGFARDKFSRRKWELRTEAAMDLAMQVTKAKSWPWPDCSNVAFPTVTLASLQFHARAYPVIVQGPDIARYRVPGPDPDGSKTARADRVGKHMSYQLMEEDESWEEQHDRLLINLPIVGCAFKKTYFSATLGHNVSELVLANDLVVDYYAKSIEKARRKSHIVPLDRNEIYEKCVTGLFRDVLEEPWFNTNAVPLQNEQTHEADVRAGTNPPTSDPETPFTTIEQHCWMDLDGDGYKEPYIVTVEHSSRAVLRIVAGWDRDRDIKRTTSGRVIKITPVEYFTKYGFIPSPDGGIYDIGFGVLLGPLNEAINSLTNQLIDAGTMSNSAGGFLAKGARLRSGATTFAPMEWKRIDIGADDIRKVLFPLPVREPSAVLFNLLSLLIRVANQIPGATDTMVGENPGQNTPASTNQSMIEQGMKIYASIFKRVWRSMKEEFKKLYQLNAIHLSNSGLYSLQSDLATREDYLDDPKWVVPVADPNVVNHAMKMQRIVAVKEASMRTPGYDLAKVEQRFLKEMQVDGWEELYPGPGKVPPLPNPRAQIEQIKLQGKQMDLEFQKLKFIAELQEEQKLNQAKIVELQAKATLELEQAGGIKTGHEIAAFDALIGALQTHNAVLTNQVKLLRESMKDESNQRGNVPGMEKPSGNAGPGAGAPPVGGGGQAELGGGQLSQSRDQTP